MTDKVKNYYEMLKSDLKRERKVDTNFKKHHILPCSMICCIGGSGSGKTNILIDFLTRKNNAFYDIVIFSGSTTDEPLFNLLKQKMPEIRIYNNIDEFPPLSEFDDDNKDQERLIVFDDFISLKPKEMKKINEYLTSGRKMGITCWLCCQNYVSCPKIVIRNLHYIMMLKLNDNVSINNIIKNHNIHDIDKDRFKQCYMKATSEPRKSSGPWPQPLYKKSTDSFRRRNKRPHSCSSYWTHYLKVLTPLKQKYKNRKGIIDRHISCKNINIPLY